MTEKAIKVEKEWHDNGMLRWKRHWQSGHLHGSDTWWSSDGEVLSQTEHNSQANAVRIDIS